MPFHIMLNISPRFAAVVSSRSHLVTNHVYFIPVLSNTERFVLSGLYPPDTSPSLHIQTWKTLFQVATAVKYLHSRDIVHRDLKSDNIGVSSSGTLKLIDFGAASSVQGMHALQVCCWQRWGFSNFNRLDMLLSR